MKVFIIDKYHENQRIDKYLKKLLPNAPSGFVYKMLRKKDVRINGIKVKENYILKRGDEVSLYLFEDRFNDYHQAQTIYHLDIQFEVVYEDEQILIVNKPAGLLVQGDSKENTNTLDKQVLAYLYQKKEYNPHSQLAFTPAPVHRLDRNTSGLVIFGKTMKALQDLNEMMKKRYCIDKKYITIVKGFMNDESLEGYVKKNEEEGKMYMVSPDSKGALRMQTEVHSLKSLKEYSLIEVQLITGRTHQIRIHLSSSGHPLMGDRKYGDFNWNKEIKERFKLNYQFLHAYALTFTKPFGSISYLKGRTFTCRPPEKLLKIIKALFETNDI